MTAFHADIADEFIKTGDLSDEKLRQLIETEECDDILIKAADKVRRRVYGDEVYLRGLIEFTSYCRNNCYYCGIRRDNRKAQRVDVEGGRQ